MTLRRDLAPRPFALWLVPTAECASILNGWVTDLARRFDGPLFAPHLTLLADIPSEQLGLAAARAVGGHREPVHATFPTIESTDDYFRSLYLRASEEGVPAIAPTFAVQQPSSFWPHVSLFYGRLELADQQFVLNELGHRVPIDIAFDAVELWHVSGRVEDWKAATRLSICDVGECRLSRDEF